MASALARSRAALLRKTCYTNGAVSNINFAHVSRSCNDGGEQKCFLSVSFNNVKKRTR